jgi:hypothetical protein
MGTVLGLFGLLVYIVAVLSLAAAVTWTVVKLSPQRSKKPKTSEPT